MTKRARELVDVGVKAADGVTPRELGLITAFAAMLDAALPAKKSKPKATGPKLPFSPQAVHQMLLNRVPEQVVCTPVSSLDFGTLGKNLKAIEGLEAEDLPKFVGWVEAGGFKNYPVTPTFTMVARNIGKYIPLAREWDRRGCQSVSGGMVGSGDAAGYDIGSDFK